MEGWNGAMRRIKAMMRKPNGIRNLGGDKANASPWRTSRSGDESGAVLILALLFLLVIGLIVGGLASWTANDLSDAVVFQNARSAEFALNGATQAAIQNIRYVPLTKPGETLNASPPSYCWGTSGDPTYGGSELTTQGDPVYVYCSTAFNAASSVTRQVTISACLQSELTPPPPAVPTPSKAAATCAANPGLQTVVDFDDYQSNLNPTSAQCQATCGTGMTIVSSSAGATAPTVTALSPSSGPVTGGTALTITGSGFVNGSTTVYLVDPLAPNDITTIQPGDVTFNSATSISVTTPGVTTSAPYYVVVSTPVGGNSLEGLQFTYQPVVPTVTSVAPNSGSANGGTEVTIDGTGFLTNSNGDLTTVTFTDIANSTITRTSPSLAVNSSGTVITATAPSILTGTTYYVTVTTKPGGTSSQSASLEFTFNPYYPVADSITPTSGAYYSIALGTTSGIYGGGGVNVTSFPGTYTGIATATSAAALPSAGQFSVATSAGTAVFNYTGVTASGFTNVVLASGSGTLTSGATIGASVTITGLGFLSGGTTVTLIPTSGVGASLTLTGVSVSSPTLLTAQAPNSGTNNAMYYISITTTWNGNPYQSCNANGTGGIPSCSSEGAPTYQY